MEYVEALKRDARDGKWKPLESLSENAVTCNDDMPAIIVEKFGPVVMSDVLDAAIDGLEKIPSLPGGSIFNYLRYFGKMISLLVPGGLVRQPHVDRMVSVAKIAPDVIRHDIEWIVEKCKERISGTSNPSACK
jgi:hypothetical protein